LCSSPAAVRRSRRTHIGDRTAAARCSPWQRGTRGSTAGITKGNQTQGGGSLKNLDTLATRHTQHVVPTPTCSPPSAPMLLPSALKTCFRSQPWIVVTYKRFPTDYQQGFTLGIRGFGSRSPRCPSLKGPRQPPRASIPKKRTYCRVNSSCRDLLQELTATAILMYRRESRLRLGLISRLGR